MPAPSIFTIEVTRIAAIDPMHHFQKVPFRCLQEQVIMVIHQNIAVNQNSITVVIVLEDIEEFHPVPILQENVLLFVSSAGDVIQRGRIFYPNRPTHG